MNIEELEGKHKELMVDSTSYTDKKHTKLSVEFAIKQLESINKDECGECIKHLQIDEKIQELKKYLNEN